MIDPAEVERYRLPEAENQRIFREEIVPELLEGCTSQETPPWDDTLMAAYTRADGRAWMAQADEYVRSLKLHAIAQETSQNAQAAEDKLRAYRQSGARIEGLFTGVPKALSDQGIVDRYFEQLADRGQGRLTVQANADESFDGILDLADRVDRGALIDLESNRPADATAAGRTQASRAMGTRR
ncbi:zeta toxin family protein [Streptomyces sp. NPDC012421]|uniref:zeta toxin family protein n=1 Tax=Streptomyces sp. NPDC012421 TaxID=3364832 RepID=UPI0036E4E9F3